MRACFLALPSAVLTLSMLIAGCVSEPTRLTLGTRRADAVKQLGTPSATYAMPAGGERLQYSRAPAGFEVNNVDLDASGHVISIRQEMDERLFDSTVQVGSWREADVLRSYGRPYEVSQVSSFDGIVWTWRYKLLNTPRLLHIYLDRAGVVQRYHTGDDLMFENLPN